MPLNVPPCLLDDPDVRRIAEEVFIVIIVNIPPLSLSPPPSIVTTFTMITLKVRKEEEKKARLEREVREKERQLREREERERMTREKEAKRREE